MWRRGSRSTFWFLVREAPVISGSFRLSGKLGSVKLESVKLGSVKLGSGKLGAGLIRQQNGAPIPF